MKENNYAKNIYLFIIITFSLLVFSCDRNTKQGEVGNKNDFKKDSMSKVVRQTPKDISLPKGLIKIPGYAFIDGRDLQAKPPLTISSINVWDSYIYKRKVVCKISHGTEIRILDAVYESEEGRYYIKVKYDNYEGWVSVSFISSKKMKPVGDIF